MNDVEKIRLLSRGLMAALRWPYDSSVVDHVHDPSIAEKGEFDPLYIADISDMHAAWRVAQENL